MITNVHRSLCKAPVILVRIQKNLNFSTYFRKIIKYQISRNPFSVSEVVPCGQMDGHG